MIFFFELFFDVYFDITSLLVSLYYSESLFGFLLNAVIVSWIADMDNTFSNNYFSNETKTIIGFRKKLCKKRLNQGKYFTRSFDSFLLYIAHTVIQLGLFGLFGYGVHDIIQRTPNQAIIFNASCALF